MSLFLLAALKVHLKASRVFATRDYHTGTMRPLFMVYLRSDSTRYSKVTTASPSSGDTPSCIINHDKFICRTQELLTPHSL